MDPLGKIRPLWLTCQFYTTVLKFPILPTAIECALYPAVYTQWRNGDSSETLK